MYILGISAYYHDSSAYLIKNGEIIPSAQKETKLKILKPYPKTMF